jgi:hypothetical protein
MRKLCSNVFKARNSAKSGLVPETIGPTAGTVGTSAKPLKVNRAAPNAPSVIYDAVLVPAGAGPLLLHHQHPPITCSRSLLEERVRRLRTMRRPGAKRCPSAWPVR